MMQDEAHQFCIVEVGRDHCVQVPIAAAVCIMAMSFAVSRYGFQGWQQSLCVLRRQANRSLSCTIVGAARLRPRSAHTERKSMAGYLPVRWPSGLLQ